MARPKRYFYSNGIYHVMNRGNNQQQIFFEDRDYFSFLDLLKTTSQRFNLRIFAFSLMPNHFHLLVQINEDNLSFAIKHLSHCYAQRFNRRKGRDGHVFKGRFRSILVDEEPYLLEVARYIHNNPVEANLCKKPEQHLYTSHRYFLRKNETFEWLDRSYILNRFHPNIELAQKEFDCFVKRGPSLELKRQLLLEHPPTILGNDIFKRSVENANAERIGV